MSQGIALLDEALNLAHQEKIALENGAYEEAMDLAEKRGELTGMAWDFLDMKDTAPYRRRILELSRLQTQMAEIATRAQDVIRNHLTQGRQEKKRMRGYHLAVGQALQ